MLGRGVEPRSGGGGGDHVDEPGGNARLLEQLGDAQGLAKLLRAGQHALDAGDGRRYTAYHCACAGGHVECAALLAKHGAALNATAITIGHRRTSRADSVLVQYLVVYYISYYALFNI